ncbi:MAG: HAD family hydrolase [Chloroflexi bacterium]|nr:HAD family hydrolase [Chloroflexota bacterium]
MTSRPALFLDRDGVLIHDVDLLAEAGQLRLYEGVPQALSRLQAAGFVLVVVSNQPVVARGLVSEDGVERLHVALQEMLTCAGGPHLASMYFCPHHPSATVERYRVDCQCRKPRPGMLLQAGRDLDLDLHASYMVGDRASDIAAGRRAGCRTILVETGMHGKPPIESPDDLPANLAPDHVCAGLPEATDFILSELSRSGPSGLARPAA